MIPLIVYALFGTSRQLAVGPVALSSLLTATSVSALGLTGDEYIQGVILITFLSGVTQVLMGIMRLGAEITRATNIARLFLNEFQPGCVTGVLTTFLAQPVVAGFTTASGLIVNTTTKILLFHKTRSTMRCYDFRLLQANSRAALAYRPSLTTARSSRQSTLCL